MSAETELETREPLYETPLHMPAGSVRAILVLLILLPFWVLVLAPDKLGPMPLYLYYLLALVLVFFASHGSTIALRHEPDPSPLWLPGGVLRVLLLFGTIAILAWRLFTNPDVLKDRLTPDPISWEKYRALYLGFSLVGGYGIGWLLARLLGPLRTRPAVLDLQAAVALFAMLLLTAAFILEVFIQPDLETRIDTSIFECILIAIVAGYFGVRS